MGLTITKDDTRKRIFISGLTKDGEFSFCQLDPEQAEILLGHMEFMQKTLEGWNNGHTESS